MRVCSCPLDLSAVLQKLANAAHKEELIVSNRPTAKRIFRLLGKVVEAGARRSNDDSKSIKQPSKELVELMSDCAQRAFSDARADVDRDEDWKRVLIWLAVSVYAGRDGPGAPPNWDTQKMLKLIGDVDEVKISRRKKKEAATDMDCCRKLIKRSPYKEMKGKEYKLLTAPGLRSALVRARKAKALLEAVGAPTSSTAS
jgi:hypothetical protein